MCVRCAQLVWHKASTGVHHVQKVWHVTHLEQSAGYEAGAQTGLRIKQVLRYCKPAKVLAKYVYAIAACTNVLSSAHASSLVLESTQSTRQREKQLSQQQSYDILQRGAH